MIAMSVIARGILQDDITTASKNLIPLSCRAQTPVDSTKPGYYNLVEMRIKRKRYMVTSIFLCLVYFIASRVPANGQSSVELAYSYLPGQTLRYKIKQEVSGTRQITGSEPVQINAELTSIIRVVCKKQISDGVWEIDVDTEDEWLKISGKAVYGYKPSKDVRTFQVTRAGRVISQMEKEGSKQRRRHGIDFGNVESILLMTVMPDTQVNVGSTWAAEMPLPVDVNSTLKLGFKLQDLKATDVGKFAIINEQISTVSNAKEDGQDNATKGSQIGEVTIFFDVGNGRIHSGQGTIRTQVVTPIDVPFVPGGRAQDKYYQTVDLTSKLTIEIAQTAVTKPASEETK